MMAEIPGIQLFRRTPGDLVWPGPLAVALTLIIGLSLSTLPLTWAMFLFAAIFVFFLALIQPLFALFLALIAGPFGALESVILGGLSFDSGQLLLFLALAAWIGRHLIDRQFNLPKTPLTIPLLIFIGVGSASLVAAPDTILGIKEVIKWFEVTAVMIMVTDLGGQLGAKKGDDGQLAKTYGVWWTVTMLMVAGVTQAAIGIWQFMFRGDGPEHFIVLGRFYRAYGTFEQPNPFGGFMNLTALLALGILIGLFTGWLLQRRESLNQIESFHHLTFQRLTTAALAVAAVATATLLGLLFSWSRGAWMGFLAGLTAMIVFWPRRLRYGLLLLIVALIGFIFLFQFQLLPPTIMDRVGGFADDLSFGDVRGVDINDENYAVLERLAHWQTALDMAGDRPWLGVGFGNYGTVYADYALINWPDPLGHAHNYYLNLVAEIGFIGLGAYLLLWGAIFWQTWRVLARETWPLRGVALGLIAIWTALMVHHLVDKLYVNNIYIHLGVLLGLLQLVDLHAGSDMLERDYTEKRRA
jgi:O-antigen ligase